MSVKKSLALTVIAVNPWSDFIPYHQYSVGMITLFIALVLKGRTSLRGGQQVIQLLPNHLPLTDGHAVLTKGPDWTTGRLWLLRLGYYQLERPKEPGKDWVWLIDHTLQLGTQKALVIVGLRLSQLPAPGQCLRHEDVQLLTLEPVDHSDQGVVEQQLEATAKKTGIPRVIVHDGGGDLRAGVVGYCQTHRHSQAIYDIKHKTACLLKALLDKSLWWTDFLEQVRKTRAQVQQTDLSYLRPPALRTQSRYMNLDTLIAWGRSTLVIVQTQPAQAIKYCNPARLKEHFGWLQDYAWALNDWTQWLAITQTVEKFVREQGHFRGAEKQVRKAISPLQTTPLSRQLGDDLLAFVGQESAKARPNERLPGSTEVVESCFGKYKALEGDHRKNGLTGLLLSLGAMMSTISFDMVKQAMAFSRNQDVWKWCRDKLGTTLQAKRRAAYAPG